MEFEPASHLVMSFWQKGIAQDWRNTRLPSDPLLGLAGDHSAHLLPRTNEVGRASRASRHETVHPRIACDPFAIAPPFWMMLRIPKLGVREFSFSF